MLRSGAVLVREGSTDVFVFQQKFSTVGPGSKVHVPFYNPSMEMNRDLSVVLCQWLLNKRCHHLDFLDGLGASGIRGLRFACELVGDVTVFINDWDLQSSVLIEENMRRLGVRNVVSLREDLNTVLSGRRFDYIDVDPFGSPVFFVDGAMQSIRHQGVVACTATDAAALCGVYPKVCVRRYGAVPLHSQNKHEVGVRILLGYLCRVAAKYNKGIVPLLGYYWDHYFRIYVQVMAGKRYARRSLQQCVRVPARDISLSPSKPSVRVGPLWVGCVYTKGVVSALESMIFETPLGSRKMLAKLFDVWVEEAEAPAFFHTLEEYASYLHVSAPKLLHLLGSLRQDGFVVSRTHFSPAGFRTNARRETVIDHIRCLSVDGKYQKHATA